MREIVIGKLVDKTLDKDYEELSEELFGDGNCFSSSEVRKRMYGMKTVIDILDKAKERAINDCSVLSEIEMRRVEMRKEQQRMFDQRAALTKLIRERSRQEELNDILTDAIKNGALPKLDYSPAEPIASNNDLLVSLNDIHYGANIANYWNTYNSEICHDMMCRYLDRIIEIGAVHNSENCIVWANGDLINGSIHHSIAVTNKENVIEQITGVSELIAGFLSVLSQHFSHVFFVSVAGNHSRMDVKERALKDERLDDLVEWYLKARLQNFENITIGADKKLDSTMYMINVRGKNYVGVHGDYDNSKEKVQSLKTMAGDDVYAVLSAHLHHNKQDVVQGVKTIMAGSFLGVDDFCVSKRIVGRPEQMICVCDETGIRCTYDIPL